MYAVLSERRVWKGRIETHRLVLQSTGPFSAPFWEGVEQFVEKRRFVMLKWHRETSFWQTIHFKSWKCLQVVIEILFSFLQKSLRRLFCQGCRWLPCMLVPFPERYPDFRCHTIYSGLRVYRIRANLTMIRRKTKPAGHSRRPSRRCWRPASPIRSRRPWRWWDPEWGAARFRPASRPIVLGQPQSKQTLCPKGARYGISNCSVGVNVHRQSKFTLAVQNWLPIQLDVFTDWQYCWYLPRRLCGRFRPDQKEKTDLQHGISCCPE